MNPSLRLPLSLAETRLDLVSVGVHDVAARSVHAHRDTIEPRRRELAGIHGDIAPEDAWLAATRVEVTATKHALSDDLRRRQCGTKRRAVGKDELTACILTTIVRLHIPRRIGPNGIFEQ